MARIVSRPIFRCNLHADGVVDNNYTGLYKYYTKVIYYYWYYIYSYLLTFIIYIILLYYNII